MTDWDNLPLGKRPQGRWSLTADWVIADTVQGRQLVQKGEVVIEADRIIFVGKRFDAEVQARFDMGAALIAPGFVDLDALSDLDTTLLAYDNWPSERKGRVWPQTYIDRGPYEMYSPAELIQQKRFAFAQLLLNGITSAAPIASLFYREWGETVDEFTGAADAAEDMGLRVWLGPAYRSGGMVVDDAGHMSARFDKARGLQGLDEAIAFAEQMQRRGGLVSPMFTPDRVETCTADLLKCTMAAANEMDCLVRLHMAQGQMELQTVQSLHGKTAPAWLDDMGCLTPRLLAPHATVATNNDLDRYQANGVTVIHCPLVSARHGNALRSFAKLRDRGINVAMGTDTAPPDMVLNMAVGMMVCRLVDGHESVRSADIFNAATIGGAKALQRDDIGVLRAGAKADIAVFDMQDPAIAPQIDPVQTLILGATGRVTRATVVDGRLSMRNGTVAGIDIAAARRQVQQQFDGLLARYPERTLGHPPVEQIFPPTFPFMNGD